jgi:hypothetical protein
MSRAGRLLPLLVVLAACALAGVGRAAPVARVAALRVDVAEWSMVPSTGVVPHGRVRISVRNLGTVTHALTVVRTAQFAADLPLRGDHAVGKPVAAPVLVPAGATRSIVVHLVPGSYVLLDNLPWHYWQGTSVAISVR